MKLIIGVLAATAMLFVLQDSFEVMLLPRRIRRRWRLTGIFFRLSWISWTWLSQRVQARDRREHLLALFGPLSMIFLFAAWAAALITGFGVLQWALQADGPKAAPVTELIYMSGVTFFTLGYGDVVPHSGPGRFCAVLEAGTGIGFIAVVIGYLPVLYQLFTRREAHVIQLDGRAGSPPSATAMLCRHAEGGGLDQLNELLREWEVWSSELLESHLSYPMLAYYRSQHDDQSWLGALACVIDACALVLVGVRAMPPLQARMTFTMGRQVLVEMSRSFGVAPSRFDGGDRLGADAYQTMEAALDGAGLDWEGGPDTQSTLAALRATYEPLLDGLAKHLLLAVPDWLPCDATPDHWAGGHRGLLAQRLMAELGDRESRPPAASADTKVRQRRWPRLRRSQTDRAVTQVSDPALAHVNAVPISTDETT